MSLWKLIHTLTPAKGTDGGCLAQSPGILEKRAVGMREYSEKERRKGERRTDAERLALLGGSEICFAGCRPERSRVLQAWLARGASR